MPIDWKNETWTNTFNLKTYIKKYGNSTINLSDKSNSELLYLAKSTEKAVALIEEENTQCKQCSAIVDECECDRCDKCYNIVDECECPKRIVFLKTFVICKKNYHDQKIQLLTHKIKLKTILHVFSKCNDTKLNNDIFRLIKMILNTYNIDDRNASTLPLIFQHINKLSIDKQISVITKICQSLQSAGELIL
jgi:hypothetical protein